MKTILTNGVAILEIVWFVLLIGWMGYMVVDMRRRHKRDEELHTQMMTSLRQSTLQDLQRHKAAMQRLSPPKKAREDENE
jgi:hypothetical protein